MLPIPGTVTNLAPFLVRLDGVDAEGQPCQRLDFPVSVDDKVAVIDNGQRLAIGRYAA